MRQELANPSPLLLAALIEPAALSRVARALLLEASYPLVPIINIIETRLQQRIG